MANLKKCDRCGDYYEPWDKFWKRGRWQLPHAKIKNRINLGLYEYNDADLCEDCAKGLDEYLMGAEIKDD